MFSFKEDSITSLQTVSSYLLLKSPSAVCRITISFFNFVCVHIMYSWHINTSTDPDQNIHLNKCTHTTTQAKLEIETE